MPPFGWFSCGRPLAARKCGQEYHFELALALSRLFRNCGHLIRPALVLLAGLGILLVVRTVVVPKDFGKFGHYRAGALEMISARPSSYAGPSANKGKPSLRANRNSNRSARRFSDHILGWKGIEIAGTHLEVTDAQSDVRFAPVLRHGSPGR